MRFVNILTVDNKGDEKEISINPDNVMFVDRAAIPTGLSGAENVPLVKDGTAIIFIGGAALRTKMTKEEVIKLLTDFELGTSQCCTWD